MSLPKAYLRLPHLQRVVGLREISGLDEQWIQNADTLTAIELIDRLVLDNPLTNLMPGQAIDLPTAERDRLLAKIYIDHFGDKITGDMLCNHCEKPFEMAFTLSDLIKKMDESRVEQHTKLVEQTEFIQQANSSLDLKSVLLKSGHKFRLATGRDELAVLAMNTLATNNGDAQKALLHACLLQPLEEDNGEVVLQAMEAVAPVMDFTLDAQCVECHQQQDFRFNIQVYLLQTLLSYKKHLLQHVHKIASAYGWSLEQILNLPRSQRLAFIGLIEGE